MWYILGSIARLVAEGFGLAYALTHFGVETELYEGVVLMIVVHLIAPVLVDNRSGGADQ